jgi:tRNA dimethylallyltransferase
VRPVIVVLGATATGKSALAVGVAEALDGEIVNADALQVYRGLDVGTAKPTVEERARVRHHVVDVLDPAEPLSAGELARLARAAIADIQGRGRLPIVVSGSGLYLRALLVGLAEMPAVDARLRAWLSARAESRGLPALRRWLRVLDPDAAVRTTEGDTQRTLRALELALGSGRAQSWWIARQVPGESPISAIRIGLTLPRSVLYHRIAERVSAMVAAGWVAEVQRLLATGQDPDLSSFQAIGYRQLAQYLRGEASLDRALDETVRATRRFAKRQSTWFRREPDVIWFRADDPNETLGRVLDFLKSRGVGRFHGEACDQHPGRFSLPEPQGGA